MFYLYASCIHGRCNFCVGLSAVYVHTRHITFIHSCFEAYEWERKIKKGNKNKAKSFLPHSSRNQTGNLSGAFCLCFKICEMSFRQIKVIMNRRRMKASWKVASSLKVLSLIFISKCPAGEGKRETRRLYMAYAAVSYLRVSKISFLKSFRKCKKFLSRSHKFALNWNLFRSAS